ncbi:MAG: hypothetical protein M3N43_05265 [Actinomycetota bacterium]|nr:hypothetical protein [Actinomycetota bacterium]
MLDALDESATQVTHIGIHQLTDPGTSTNANSGEATGGSPAYARQAVTWASASGRVKGNSGTLTFDVPAGTYGFFTLWNASSGNSGNYRGHIPFGGSNALRGFFSVDSTLANDQLLSKSHGLADGDRVLLYNVFSEALPTGLTEGSAYYVVSSTSDTFKVSTTLGGSAVDITGVGGGEGYWQRVVPESFGAQGQITVAVSALALDGSAF